jgi:hypothetical protein
MLERDIIKSEVLAALNSGIEIEQYPDDFPYPSSLLFKFVNERPIHIVVAYNVSEKQIIVTAYIAEEETFEPDFMTRKKKS